MSSNDHWFSTELWKETGAHNSEAFRTDYAIFAVLYNRK